MFKRKIIYSLVIGLLMAHQTVMPVNLQDQPPPKQSRVAQIVQSTAFKTTAGIGAFLIMAAFIVVKHIQVAELSRENSELKTLIEDLQIKFSEITKTLEALHSANDAIIDGQRLQIVMLALEAINQRDAATVQNLVNLQAQVPELPN